MHGQLADQYHLALLVLKVYKIHKFNCNTITSELIILQYIRARDHSIYEARVEQYQILSGSISNVVSYVRLIVRVYGRHIISDRVSHTANNISVELKKIKN